MSERPPSHTSTPLERPLVRGLIALVLLAALAGGAFLLQSAGGGGASSSDKTASAQTTPAGTPGAGEAGFGALDSHAPVVGQPAPDFALRDINGNAVKLSDLRGKVVYVNFWATWCVPCKQELPDIETIYSEKQGQGLEVLEVNWQESRDLAKSYFDERDLPMPLLLDTESSVFNQYHLQGLPDSFFIDRQGNLSSFYYGQLSLSKMRDRIARAGLP